MNPINRRGIVVRDEVDTAWSSYVEAEAMFRRSLDAKSHRLFLIAKSIAVRNAALDRYIVAVERPDQLGRSYRTSPGR